MKLMFKLILTILVLAFVLPFTPLMPGGKPMMSLSDIRLPEFSIPNVPTIGSKEPVLRKSGKARTFYRWKDAEGKVHYSDKPPEGSAGEVASLDIDPNTNLVPAVEAPPEPEPVASKVSDKKKSADSSSPTSSYSPDAIKKLFEDANRIKQQALERNKLLQGAD